MHQPRKDLKLGTSSLVVAAFVGPGTVLTCASAGVNFGYALGWVLFFSVLSVFVLQSFTAGTGILARKGLGEAMREATHTPLLRGVLFTLVILGLWVGCAAFELGNLMGAATGLQAIMPGEIATRWYVLLLGILAGLMLLLNLKHLIQALAVLVGFMGVLFLLTLFLAPVDWAAAWHGLIVPTLPEGSIVTVVALIGTTIVTYNLFLHAAATKTYWQHESSTIAWRRELTGMAVFLPLGGLISFAILVAGATFYGQEAAPQQAAAFASLLEPVAGPAARYLFGLGLFAAGLTSAITAPLAAATGIREIFDWPEQENDYRFRLVWLSVLLTGLFFGLTDWSPLQAIIAAQAANGVLLPFMAAFMLFLVYRQRSVTLPRWYLGIGVLITAICGLLGYRTLAWVWGQL